MASCRVRLRRGLSVRCCPTFGAVHRRLFSGLLNSIRGLFLVCHNWLLPRADPLSGNQAEALAPWMGPQESW
jgi:hypothetical protein